MENPKFMIRATMETFRFMHPGCGREHGGKESREEVAGTNKVECSNVFKMLQTTPSCKVKNVATGLSGCLQTSGWLARCG